MTRLIHLSAVSLALCAQSVAQAAEYFIAGNDEKIFWDASGNTLFLPDNDKDTIDILKIGDDRSRPEIVATLTVENSIFGPPTNAAISPDQKFAYVANSMKWVEADGKWSAVPNNEIHVLSLGKKSKLLKTIKLSEMGQQPSGMDLTADGKYLLVGNRAGKSVLVFEVSGADLEEVASIDVGSPAAGITIEPNGKRALFLKKPEHKVGILYLDFEAGKFSHDPAEDINVGQEPYNVCVSPLGDIALVNNQGPTGGNDGNVDTVSVIDLTGARPYVCDQVVVGDGPEGLAFSPDGKFAVSICINGSQNAKANPVNAWAANEGALAAILKIDGKSVEKVAAYEVGGMAEGAVFTQDGEYLYLGNFLSGDLSVLKRVGDSYELLPERVELSGHPGWMRGVEKW
ncbi:YncE family protein [Pelagicoccus mobilis]|uniref:Beta-propeller fold lactonase family protein n=1 Tax=Pelagicoccus mobilis TaxID=415221 RepID=A0A934RXD3_9BACT|nr:beta-propeller fold lactonase family protein [Pelagicoccus mobilis]MBK1879475.1 beta-propeller fold lactonase family protein [Pelagicoccus mobilis]